MCALNIQKTISYFYTSYGFANTFQTPDPGSVEIYQKSNFPQLWLGKRVTDELHILNATDNSRYVRVAHMTYLMSEDKWTSPFLTQYSGAPYDNWNATDGIKIRQSDITSYVVNDAKWIENDFWYYYKTPLASQTDIQILDSVGGPEDMDGLVDSGDYINLHYDFIVETLPADISDEEFEEAWGVSKSELGLS